VGESLAYRGTKRRKKVRWKKIAREKSSILELTTLKEKLRKLQHPKKTDISKKHTAKSGQKSHEAPWMKSKKQQGERGRSAAKVWEKRRGGQRSWTGGGGEWVVEVWKISTFGRVSDSLAPEII